jgi:hypothetical protein
MSAGPENTFIQAVHRYLPRNLYSMKNHNMYNGGIADCWYSGAGRDLWIEWKFIVAPKKDDTVVNLHAGKQPSMSALQRDWLRSRFDEGRNVWVGIGSADGGVLFKDPREWETPFTAGEFRKWKKSRLELAAFITGFVIRTS